MLEERAYVISSRARNFENPENWEARISRLKPRNDIVGQAHDSVSRMLRYLFERLFLFFCLAE